MVKDKGKHTFIDKVQVSVLSRRTSGRRQKLHYLVRLIPPGPRPTTTWWNLVPVKQVRVTPIRNCRPTQSCLQVQRRLPVCSSTGHWQNRPGNLGRHWFRRSGGPPEDAQGGHDHAQGLLRVGNIRPRQRRPLRHGFYISPLLQRRLCQVLFFNTSACTPRRAPFRSN